MKKETGMAIMTILLLTVLLVLMTVSMIFISTNHLSLIGNIEAKEKALKAAESGIEYAMSKLNEHRDWGLYPLTLSNFHENGDVDFTKDATLTAEIPYATGAKFTITFAPSSRYCSVNNLFSSQIDDNGTPGYPDDDTPAYTAKIISIGECGEGGDIKKRAILQAFFVRSTYYPYTINTAGRMVFGPSKTTAIRGDNYSDPGYIYSDWKSEDSNSIFSPNETRVICNNGIFSARGEIYLPDFDGQEMENITRSNPMSHVDVDNIVTRARDGELGALTVMNNVGKVVISEKPVDIDSIEDSGTVRLYHHLYPDIPLH